MAPPKTDTAPTQVLTDPALWRCITSFQSGLPMPLKLFWEDHGRRIRARPQQRGMLIEYYNGRLSDLDLMTDGTDHLLKLVVEHGSVHQLEQLAAVKYYSPHGSRRHECKTISLYSLSDMAIAWNHPDMLEWAITHDTHFYGIERVWGVAINCHRYGDYRVLDLLRLHKPIDSAQLTELTYYVNDVDLWRWFGQYLPHRIRQGHVRNAVDKGKSHSLLLKQRRSETWT